MAFGVVNFEAASAEDMKKIAQVILGSEDWFETVEEDAEADCGNCYSVHTDEDDLNWDLFEDSDTLIARVNEVFEKAGVEADYECWYEGKDADDNFFVKNGESVQQFMFDAEESADNTYMCIVDLIEDGDIFLGWYGTTDYVYVETYLDGEELGGIPVMVETNASGTDCYSAINGHEYFLKTAVGDIPLADTPYDLNELYGDDLKKKILDYMSEHETDKNCFLQELTDNSGVEFDDDFDLNRLEFKIE